MIRAEFAGRGKSHACKQMEKRGCKVLFVRPANKFASKCGDIGCTVNRFFSRGMTEDCKMAKFDGSHFLQDGVVVDGGCHCCDLAV